jgi:hypothetical protein
MPRRHGLYVLKRLPVPEPRGQRVDSGPDRAADGESERASHRRGEPRCTTRIRAKKLLEQIKGAPRARRSPARLHVQRGLRTNPCACFSVRAEHPQRSDGVLHVGLGPLLPLARDLGEVVRVARRHWHEPVPDWNRVSGIHEVGIARPARGHDDPAQAHRLHEVQAQALRTVQGEGDITARVQPQELRVGCRVLDEANA